MGCLLPKTKEKREDFLNFLLERRRKRKEARSRISREEEEEEEEENNKREKNHYHFDTYLPLFSSTNFITEKIVDHVRFRITEIHLFKVTDKGNPFIFMLIHTDTHLHYLVYTFYHIFLSSGLTPKSQLSTEENSRSR